MKFLVDRCAGKRIADWLFDQGHDVVEARELGPDPGDLALLRQAHREGRILVTLDTDFGALVFLGREPHSGLIRLPDVISSRRIELLAMVLERHTRAIEKGSVITVQRDRIRISRPA